MASLEAELPPVTLLVGPSSVGKQTIAHWAAARHGAARSDVFTYRKLDMEAARDLRRLLAVRPHGKLRVIIVRLDGTSDDVLNALLKVLEEPPNGTHFILTSTTSPLLTVQSRARTHRVGHLHDSDVEQILLRRGMTPNIASTAAARSGGSVSSAMEASFVDQQKGPVLSALKATADGDLTLLQHATTGKAEGEYRFGERQVELLRRWAVESRTGRWRTFTKAESYGLSDDERLLRDVLNATDGRIRPRIAAKRALLPSLERRRMR